MSKYADLRWKIADLEKAPKEEKIYSQRLREDIERYIRMMYAKDNAIKELKQIISALGDSDNK